MMPAAMQRREILFSALLLVLFLIAQMADPWVFHHVAYAAIYDRGWGRMLRLVGYVPFWALVGASFVLHDWVPRARTSLFQASRRGRWLVGSTVLAGIIAEGLKLLFRRERPAFAGGVHVYRPWSDQPFSSSAFGLPSSEAAVAFAAATVLARLFPESRILWYAMAIGCGLTRIASGAHFLSDVVLGALVGYLTGAGLRV
ncbi:MAG TPA: phosphatase PAP2 family protein [Gemmatimonadales bacterium]|nr:phosphatase PAP2 family protein [Gemmatimonadales bacterium]